MQFLFSSVGGIVILVLLLIGVGAMIFFTRFGRAAALTMLVIFAALGIHLSAKTLKVRNSWSKKVSELQVQNEANSKELVEKRLEVQEFRDEFDRVRYGWGRIWDNVESKGVAGPLLSANFGLNQGLGSEKRPEPPVVYAYGPDPAGGTVYIGRFQATPQLQENNVTLRPTHLVRSGYQQLQILPEIRLWEMGRYRFRETVPDSYSTLFSNLRARLTDADEQLVEKQKFVENQTKLVETAQRDLDNRLLELGFNRMTSQQTGGLLEAIEKEEQERNALLGEIDALRRDREKTLKRFRELNRENKSLAKQLAGGPVGEKASVTVETEGN